MALRIVRSNPKRSARTASRKSQPRRPRKNPLKRKVIAGNVRKMEREGYPKASLRKAGVKRKQAAAVLSAFGKSGIKPTIGNFRAFAKSNGGKALAAPLGTYVYRFPDASIAVAGKGKVVVL